jgi:hypothetical protein
VRVYGIPADEEVRALAELPNLRHLVIRRPESADDLGRLRPLVGLRVLGLEGVALFAHHSLRSAAGRALPAATVQITSSGA